MNRDRVRKYMPVGPCVMCPGSVCKLARAPYASAHLVIDVLRDLHRDGFTITRLAKIYEIPRDIVSYLAKTPIKQLDWIRRIR